MTIRKLILFSLGVLLMAGVATVRAQGQPKMGFVDIPYVIDRAPAAKAASERLEKEFAPRQKVIQDQRVRLKEMGDRLEKDALIMTDTERRDLERDMRSLERQLRRDEQDFREELNIQKNEEFKKVRLSVIEAINQLAKEGGFDLILSEGVLYSSKRLDLTEKVLEYMQKSAGQPAAN